MLSPGSIIHPGNWGRLVRRLGWQHGSAMREMALELARRTFHPTLPSRLDCAFVLLTRDEADLFKQHNQGFAHHLLYRVTLTNPDAAQHVADSRLCVPVGTFRSDWANVYWQPYEAQFASIPGVDRSDPAWTIPLREMLTLSKLRVEERLD